ncbi:MAG: RHS repeat-associated core domain-containing protein [Bacteroidaceae bacterium]|nr:RHS repeat-associated core domain-containing protein [Bacteroidaceae bacterium]
MMPTKGKAQSATQNYIVTERMLDAGGTRSVKSVQYYDGLGRPNVSVANGVNTSGKSVCTMTKYDGMGRESRRWLPAVVTSSLDFVDATTMASKSRSTYGDGHAYSDIEYDALGRPIFSVSEGEAWHKYNKGKKVEYITNAAKSVKHYVVNNQKTCGIAQQGYYSESSLMGEKHTDEDGHTIEIYRDLLDNVVLERRDGNNDTYYVYESGLLRVVAQPMYQKSPSLSYYTYRYWYDAHGRCVKKQLPSCQPIQYWYDKYGRLAFMQDDRLRKKNKYRFYMYDGLSRMVVQGLCSDTVGCNQSASVVFKAGAAGIDNSGYVMVAGSAVPNGAAVEIVNYYDGYDCFGTSYFAGAAKLQKTSDVCTTTLLTAQIVSTTNKDDAHKNEKLLRVMYYDQKGRVVDERHTMCDDMMSRSVTNYSFTDKPLCVTTTVTAKGTLFHTLKDSMVYDLKSDLLLKQIKTIDGLPSFVVASYKYNELGQVTECERGNGLLTDLYDYDVHGWQLSHGTIIPKMYYAPVMQENLYYADGPNAVPCYNGNVSAMTYRSSDGVISGYKYRYDGMDRLTSAQYAVESDLSRTPDYEYSENVEYNANSAITFLQRTGKCLQGAARIDNLEMGYLGNCLNWIKDTGTPDALMNYEGAFHFRDGYDNHSEYAYDGCGSMIEDRNKGVVLIDYDFNGMPRRVQFKNGDVTEYVYASDGTKLKTIHRTAVNGIDVDYGSVKTLTKEETQNVDSTTYFAGFEIYKNLGDARHFYDGGYIALDMNGHCSKFLYVKDHLGNVRAVVDGDGRVVQSNAYYPYGGLAYVSDNTMEMNRMQHRKFEGKELDRLHGLDLYEFGARQYDAAICQFTSIDPLCEKYYHISPYAYCAGNPVRYTDPTGDTIRVDELYRAQFINSLVDVFGEQTSNSFGFDDRGNLTFNGIRNGLSKEQKKALKGLQKTMESKDVTNVIYGKSYDNNDANVHVSESDMLVNSGAITILASENPNTSENFIVVDPSASDAFPVDVVTADYYRLDGKSKYAKPDDVLFRASSCKTNVTDRVFHEFGHVLYDGKIQSGVIDYNNHIRKILNLPNRKYDSYHNRLIKQ